VTDEPDAAWPLFGLRLRCGEVVLRPVRERDLAHLAAIQPDDYEHDPRVAVLPWMDVRQHRTRLVHQEYWRSMGTWSPSSWCLGFAVEHGGQVVGVQSVEADGFPVLRTVDSGSWRARGQGTRPGSGDADGRPRPRVRPPRCPRGRHLGVVELLHLRLTAADWQASGRGADVHVDGVGPCLPWFGRSGSG
jgi:hypothetical protein